MWGQKFSPDDPLCQDIHQMNINILALNHPLENGPLLDLFPSLFKLPKALFPDAYKLMDKTREMIDEFIHSRIKEAKVGQLIYLMLIIRHHWALLR